MHRSHIIEFPLNISGIFMNRCFEFVKIKISDIRSGSDAVTVYIIRYIDACIRSG